MSKSIWEYTRYSAPINFLIGAEIQEYDVSKANISVLVDQGIITEKEYQYYLNLPKRSREIKIGLLSVNNKSVRDGISKGIEQCRHDFLLKNKININEILSIRNDAIFLINSRQLDMSIAPHTHFRLANRYTSFYKLDNIEIYYGYLPIENKEIFDVKGINDEVLELHKDYMVKFLISLFYYAQNLGIKSAIEYIKDFYNQFISMELDINYYRRFDSESLFDIKQFDGQENTTRFSAYIWDSKYKNFIDPSYNEYLLRILYGYYISLLFRY